MKKLIIDEEFRDLIPSLSKEETDTLRESILSYGIRESIIIWKGHNIILDGHNRYKIATEEDITFSVAEYVFMSRSEVMVWMIDNQRGRRNLTRNDMLKLGMKRAELLEEKAKEKEYERKTTFQKSEKSNLPTINTTKEMADYAGVSVDTANKYKKIMREATEEIKEEVENGTKSINKAYVELKKPESILFETGNNHDYRSSGVIKGEEIVRYAERAIANLSHEDNNIAISVIRQWIEGIEE